MIYWLVKMFETVRMSANGVGIASTSTNLAKPLLERKQLHMEYLSR